MWVARRWWYWAAFPPSPDGGHAGVSGSKCVQAGGIPDERPTISPR